MARKSAPAYETEKDIFPTILRNLMSETKTSQEKIANAIGVTRQTISLYTTGQSSPDWKKLKAIAEFFNVSADYLLGLSDVATPVPDVRAMHDHTGLSTELICALNNLKETELCTDFVSRLSQFILSLVEQNFQSSLYDCTNSKRAEMAFNCMDDMISHYLGEGLDGPLSHEVHVTILKSLANAFTELIPAIYQTQNIDLDIREMIIYEINRVYGPFVKDVPYMYYDSPASLPLVNFHEYKLSKELESCLSAYHSASENAFVNSGEETQLLNCIKEIVNAYFDNHQSELEPIKSYIISLAKKQEATDDQTGSE